MFQNENRSGKRKLGSEYSAELLELHDADPEEIEKFCDELNLDDWETVVRKIIRACDVLIAQQE